MANKPAFKNGKPLFKNGVLAFGDTGCTCCGTCTCADLTPGHCARCATGCEPTSVEAVLSGISTNCCSGTLGRSTDANGATLAGTFVMTPIATGCVWQFNSTSAPFNIRIWSGAACTGAATGNQPWVVSITVGVSTIDVAVQGTTSGFGATQTFFSGSTANTAGCTGTYVISNGTGSNPNPCGSGGTITLTFCP